MALDTSTPVFGIDVSHHQGVIDWQRLAKTPNLSWAYLKASEGSTFVDKRFASNAAGAIEAGLPVGAYHYARPNNNTPESEADHFLATIATAGGQQALSLRPMLDFEEPASSASASNYPQGADAIAWIERWFARVKQKTGQSGVLYTGPNVLARLGAKNIHLPDTLLWVPRYPNNNDQSLDLNTQAIKLYLGGNYEVDNRLPNWSTDIWQYTGHGKIPGLVNPQGKMRSVDMNLTDARTFARMKTNGGGGMLFASAAVVAALVWMANR